MEQWELEEKRREFISDFYYEKLNFCGCGSPWDTLYVIKNLLNILKVRSDRWDLEDYNARSHEYYELHQKELKECFNLKDNVFHGQFSINDGVIQVFLNVLDNCDVLEHGGSIGGSWLTSYGEELLEHLNKLNDEELEYILN